jgi:rhodanese-related sulfurtransferase
MTATLSFAQVHEHLRTRREVALLDVREEGPYSEGHPLWAANMPLSRLELQAWRRIPRRETPIVLYGEHDGQDLAALAAARLAELGYTHVHRLAGGLEAWRAAGGELFRDVNVPSKAFGEWVEHHRHTPSLSAQEVQALIDEGADIVVLDARRYDEYHTMSIPTAISVPGAELVLRVRELAPDATTRVIVNCAGRTRSLIGAQSLVNAGIPNPVAALRNGTIGWTLAGQRLDHGASRRAPPPSKAHLAQAQADARAVAGKASVRWIAFEQLRSIETPGRTVYRFDVRSREEYDAGHLPGFASTPGGQLVQETDHHAPVRGARLVLADDDGVRAPMSASWLAQMGWEVYVVEPVAAMTSQEPRTPAPPRVTGPAAAEVSVATLSQWLAESPAAAAVIDVSNSASYAKSHIPGAWFAIRAQLAQALARIPAARSYVVTGEDPLLAAFAARDLRELLDARGNGEQAFVLPGGNPAWSAAGLPVESSGQRHATPPTDRYRRPYEGTDAPEKAMQDYLDWEYGLVAQLERDGTHCFKVLDPNKDGPSGCPP